MKSVLCLLTLCVAVTYCAASECRWGPAFWCQNETTAKQCGQLTYCQTSVWKTTEQVQQVKLPKGSTECDICKIVVQLLDKYLDNNETETEAKDDIEKACSYLGPLEDDCKSFINDYFDEIWQLLMKETDPDTICSLIGLCSSITTPKLTRVSRPDSVECDVCELVAKFLLKYVEDNATETEAKDAVEKFCGLLPSSVSEVCQTFVKEYFDEIWQLLAQDLTPKAVCQDMNLCSSSVKLAKQLAPKDEECDACKDVTEFLQTYLDNEATEEEARNLTVEICHYLPVLADQCKVILENFNAYWAFLQDEVDKDTVCYQLNMCASARRKIQSVTRPPQKEGQDLCDTCKLVVNFLQTFVDSTTDEDEVKQALEMMCELLPKTYSTECNTLIDEYFDLIWSLMKSELDNDLICQQIGVCNSTKIQSVTRPPQKEGQDICSLCELVVSFVKPFVDANSTEEEAKNGVEMLCGFLPDTYKDMCDSLVTEYFPLVWSLLKAEVDCGQVCELIGLCKNEIKIQILTRPPQKEGQDICSLCELVVSFVKPFVDSNSTEGEVKQALESLCKLLPSSTSAECETYVTEYFGVIWELLKQEVDDNQICQLIGLCNSTKVAVVKPKAMAPESVKCLACRTAETLLRPILDSSAAEGDIGKALKTLCSIIPSKFRADCQNFMNGDYQLVWEVLKEEVDTKELCNLIKFCTPSSLPRVEVAVAKQSTKTKAPEIPVLCQLCEYLVEKLENMILTNSSEAYLLGELEKLCADMPSELGKECMYFVKTYGKEVIDDLLKGVGAKVVCTLIQVCGLGTQTNTFAFVSKPKLDVCSVCEIALGFIKDLGGDNSTEEFLTKALEMVCSFFPSPLKKECAAFIGEYGEQVLQLVDQAINPKEDCQKIGACPKSFSSAMATPWKMIERSLTKV